MVMNKVAGKEVNILSEGVRHLLSSYSQGINKQEDRTGSLFTQNTNAKLLLTNNQYNLPRTCFHYIHQNPMKANLVKRMEDWKYSSFPDYAGLRNGNLCDKANAVELLDISLAKFIEDSYAVIPDSDSENIW